MSLPISRGCLALFLTVSAADFGPLPQARAQADGFVEPPAYRAAVDEAVGEYEAQHFEEARALFARAHATFPNARSLRGLGMVEFELRNYGTSIQHLEAALASKVRPLEGALRAQTEELLERARRFVGHVALKVSPGSSRVIVDGVPVEVAPGKALVLQVGDHTLEVQAEGYSPERRTVSLRGGETQTLQIALRAPIAPSAPEPVAMRERQPAPWILIGAGGVVAVTGGVLAGIGLKKKSDVENAPHGARWSEYESANSAAPIFTGVGFAMVGVGLASVGAGLTWTLMSRSKERPLPLQLSGQPRGIQVSGRF